MGLVTYDFYTNTYYGEPVSVDDFPRYEARAEDTILIMIKKTSEEAGALPASVLTLVQKAICAQIDYLFEYGMGVSVYIKNIIPDRMKLKLVIIDRLQGGMDGRRMEYHLPEEGRHIDRWCYSPRGSARQIVSDFRGDNGGDL